MCGTRVGTTIPGLSWMFPDGWKPCIFLWVLKESRRNLARVTPQTLHSDLAKFPCGSKIIMCKNITRKPCKKVVQDSFTFLQDSSICSMYILSPGEWSCHFVNEWSKSKSYIICDISNSCSCCVCLCMCVCACVCMCMCIEEILMSSANSSESHLWLTYRLKRG